MSEDSGNWRYFVTYSGVKLPLKLVEELTEADLGFRNTYFRAHFDAQDRITVCEKMVRGDVYLSHRYTYDDAGTLKRAEIMMDEDETVLEF